MLLCAAGEEFLVIAAGVIAEAGDVGGEKGFRPIHGWWQVHKWVVGDSVGCNLYHHSYNSCGCWGVQGLSWLGQCHWDLGSFGLTQRGTAISGGPPRWWSLRPALPQPQQRLVTTAVGRRPGSGGACLLPGERKALLQQNQNYNEQKYWSVNDVSLQLKINVEEYILCLHQWGIKVFTWEEGKIDQNS